MGIVDYYFFCSSIKGTEGSRIDLLGHELAATLIVLTLWNNLINVDYTAYSFHIARDVDSHGLPNIG